jgi:hypothetical protein
MDDNRKQSFIRIASTINWVMAAINFLSLVAIMIPICRRGEIVAALPFVITIAIVTALYGLVGWGLRRFAKWAGIVALVNSGLMLIFGIIGTLQGPKGLIGLLVGGSIFAFVILGWKALK